MTSPWQKPFRGMQINKAHPLARGLVGAWAMNERTGNAIFDYSGNANHGTNNGADWVADGLDFNGSSDNIDCGQIISGYPFTLVSLMTPHAPGQEVLVSFAEGDDATYHAILLDGDEATVRSYDGTIYDATGVGIITANEQYNIAGVWVGASSRKLYVNGDFISENTGTESGIGYAVTKIGVTADSTPWGYLDGVMSYGLIYNRALTPEEIIWLNREPYAMFEQPISPGLLYYEAAEPPTGNPQWYYQMLRRRN